MHGITVTLYEPSAGTPDAFNDATVTYTAATVDNVLVGQPTTDEITSGIDLYGKKAEYMLGIPKGDAHNWEDAEVEFFGRRWKAFGMVIQGIEDNVPTPWHKKVRVARYE